MLNKESIIKATRDLFDTIPVVIDKLSNLSIDKIVLAYRFSPYDNAGTELTLTVEEMSMKRNDVFAVIDEFKESRVLHVEIPFTLDGSQDVIIIDIEKALGNNTFEINGYTKKESHLFLSKKDITKHSKNVTTEDDPVEGFDFDGSINFLPSVFHHKIFVRHEENAEDEVAACKTVDINWQDVRLLKPEKSDRTEERIYLKKMIEKIHYASKFAYPGTEPSEFKPGLMRQLVADVPHSPMDTAWYNPLLAAVQITDSGTSYANAQMIREFHNALCNQLQFRCNWYKQKYDYDIEKDAAEEGFYIFGDTKASGRVQKFFSSLIDLCNF